MLYHRWLKVCSVRRSNKSVLGHDFLSNMICHRILHMRNTTVIISEAGTVYPSWTPEFTPGFSGVHVIQSLAFCAVICVPLFIFFCHSCCSSIYGLRLPLWYICFCSTGGTHRVTIERHLEIVLNQSIRKWIQIASIKLELFSERTSAFLFFFSFFFLLFNNRRLIPS